MDIVWSEEKRDRCRVDFIYTTGYKTEITARAAEGDFRDWPAIDRWTAEIAETLSPVRD